MIKILLVEDDKIIVASLSEYLNSEGYLVRSVSGQTAAMKLLAEEKADLVLLDVSLAEGNGFAACRAIKAEFDVPVIFLTASGDEFSTVTGFDLGADDYIPKPFRPRELMNLKIYTYDKYDMVDIANLKVGDTVVRHSGEVKVISKEQNEAGTIYINGGLENGGFDLVTDDCGIFYETGFNDVKDWYEIGEATIRVSADFKGIDNADLEQGEVIIYPGDFLIGAVTNYDFTPYNTTIRVEDGQIVEMNRVFIP